jgi:N-acetyl-alpha-D-muramate 1-phosphate uridylyltransferase
LHRRLFDAAAGPVFSLVRLFDHAEAAGRLAAIEHDGEWYHVGTPEGLALTRVRLSSHCVER